MRIPTSLIVMSIATAIPFGLAIRDTVRGAPHRLTADEKAAAEERAADEAYKAEQAAQEALEAKEAHAVIARIPTLYGATPASFGTALRGFDFGKPVSEELQKQWESEQMISLYLEWNDEGTATTSVTVRISDVRDACDQLRAKVVDAWGAPTNSTWLAPNGLQRAHLDSCELVFEPTVTPAAWLAAVDVIGQPESRLIDSLSGALLDDGSYRLHVPGMGYGSNESTITAELAKSKVVYVRAEAETDFDSLVALRDAIAARMKSEPSVDDDSGDWLWKKAPTMRLHRDEDSNIVTLTIGKEPTE